MSENDNTLAPSDETSDSRKLENPEIDSTVIAVNNEESGGPTEDLLETLDTSHPPEISISITPSPVQISNDGEIKFRDLKFEDLEGYKQ